MIHTTHTPAPVGIWSRDQMSKTRHFPRLYKMIYQYILATNLLWTLQTYFYLLLVVKSSFIDPSVLFKMLDFLNIIILRPESGQGNIMFSAGNIYLTLVWSSSLHNPHFLERLTVTRASLLFSFLFMTVSFGFIKVSGTESNKLLLSSLKPRLGISMSLSP